MEKGLRDCCRSMRIGKILIRRDQDTKLPKVCSFSAGCTIIVPLSGHSLFITQVYYAKFPPSIEQRKILLLQPVVETGATVSRALEVLKEHGVNEKNVVLVTLFCTPLGAYSCLKKFPNITVLTSEVHEQCPSHFGPKYFGSD